MRVGRISTYFRNRWRQEVGADPAPTVEFINRLIAEGVTLLRGRSLYRMSEDARLVRFYELSMVWNDRHGIILQIDDRNGNAVTFWRGRRPFEYSEERGALRTGQAQGKGSDSDESP